MWVYLLIVLVFLADRVSKWWAAAYFAHHGPLQVTGWLTLRETYNTGVVFGMLQGVGSLVGWLSIGIVAVMLVYLTRVPREQVLVRVGLALIIGGALGNMIDRVLVGRVLDFVQLALPVGIFNLSDVFINVGLVVLAVGAIWGREPADAAAE